MMPGDAHQRWLEAPYVARAAEDEQYEHWVENVAEDTYNQLVKDQDENLPASPSTYLGLTSSGTGRTEVVTYEEWINDDLLHYPHYESWCKDGPDGDDFPEPPIDID